jgi:ubiquinone/menaquinone biosynthesis C-methylase UbiE
MNQKQKDKFSVSEGDAWFERNHAAFDQLNYNESDPVIQAVDQCLFNQTNNDLSGQLSLLEVGCGEAKRLEWLQENRSIECFGVEPSTKAVDLAIKRGVKATKGTADDLPFEKQKFNFVVFGFCLYLCDREDLFRIALEADRVLQKTGWLIIHDFFAVKPIDKPYHHLEGVRSYKMDYRKLWDWHSSYMCYSHQIHCHGTANSCDDPDQWVATSILRKTQLK